MPPLRVPRCTEYVFEQDPRQPVFDPRMKENVELAYDKFQAGLPIFISTAARKGPFQYEQTFPFAEKSRKLRARQVPPPTRPSRLSRHSLQQSLHIPHKPRRKPVEVQESLDQDGNEDVTAQEEFVSEDMSDGVASTPSKGTARHFSAVPSTASDDRLARLRRLSPDRNTEDHDVALRSLDSLDAAHPTEHDEANLRRRSLSLQHPASSISKSSYLPTPIKQDGDPEESADAQTHSPLDVGEERESTPGYPTPDDSSEDAPELIVEDTFADGITSDEHRTDEEAGDAALSTFERIPDATAPDNEELDAHEDTAMHAEVLRAKSPATVPYVFDLPPSTFTAVNATALPQPESVQQATPPQRPRVKTQGVSKQKVVKRAVGAAGTTENAAQKVCHDCTRSTLKTWHPIWISGTKSWRCGTCYKKDRAKKKAEAEKAAAPAPEQEEIKDSVEVADKVEQPQEVQRARSSKIKAKQAIKNSHPVLSQRIESQPQVDSTPQAIGKSTSFLNRRIPAKKNIQFGRSPHQMVIDQMFSAEAVLDALNLQPKVHELLGKTGFAAHVERRLTLGTLLTPHRHARKTTDLDIVAPPLSPASRVTQVKKRRMMTFDTPDAAKPKKLRKREEQEAVTRDASPTRQAATDAARPSLHVSKIEVAKMTDVEHDIEHDIVGEAEENAIDGRALEAGLDNVPSPHQYPELRMQSSKETSPQSHHETESIEAHESVQKSPTVSTQAFLREARVSDLFDSSMPSPEHSGVGEGIAPGDIERRTPATVHHRTSSQEFVHPESPHSSPSGDVLMVDEAQIGTQAMLDDCRFLMSDDSPEAVRTSAESHQGKRATFGQHQSSPLTERRPNNDTMMPPPSTVPSGSRKSALKKSYGVSRIRNGIVSPGATPNFLPSSSAGMISSIPAARRHSGSPAPHSTRMTHIMDMYSQRRESQDPDFDVEDAADTTMAMLQGSQGSYSPFHL